MSREEAEELLEDLVQSAGSSRRKMGKAHKLYEDFHKYEPLEVGEFSSSFSIPDEVCLAGDAVFVMYRSKKSDPVTYVRPKRPINYIHDHKPGVKLYRCDGRFDGPVRKVPKYIQNATELVFLGQCLGFCYKDEDGEEVEAEGTKPLPELYSIPSGKALLVIQGKKKLLAMIWGGKLDVEPRGIVG